MKKTGIVCAAFVLLFSASVFCASEADMAEAEKYFSKSVQFYLNGELDNSINLLTRALQKDPGNVKYSSLYDMILAEKDRLKVIKLDRNYADERQVTRRLNEELNADVKKYLISMNKGYSSKVTMLNERIQNIANAISNENQALRTGQDRIVNQIIPEAAADLGRTKLWLWLTLGLTLSLGMFLFAVAAVIISNSRRLRKAEESLKYLSVRQDDQLEKIRLVEEEQRRLREKNG